MANPLTRKIGPLPAYAYAVGIGGVILAFRLMKGSGSSADTQQIIVPTGAPQVDINRAFLDDLADKVDNLSQQINTNTDDMTEIPSPSVSNNTDNLLQQILSKLGGTIQPAPAGNGAKDATPAPATNLVSQLGTNISTIGAKTNAALAYTTRSADAARAHALRVIRDYSPGGALYGKGAAGSVTTRTAIPYINPSVLSPAEQLEAAKRYAAAPHFILSATGTPKVGSAPAGFTGNA